VGLKRGDIVLVVFTGEFGKPRPALVIQTNTAFPSEYITCIPITGTLRRVPDVRIPIQPTQQNGLTKPSELMVDLVQTASLSRFRNVIGVVETETMMLVERSLSLHLGLD
jgi:mRNA interferase MazF